MAHQQMFGVAFFYWLAGKLFGNENKKNKGKKVKRIEDIELPGFMSMFNDNMVSASILMLAFFEQSCVTWKRLSDRRRIYAGSDRAWYSM